MTDPKRNQQTCKHEHHIKLAPGRDWLECQECQVLINEKDGLPRKVDLRTSTYSKALMAQLAEEGTASIMVRPSIDAQEAARKLKRAAVKLAMPVRCSTTEDSFGRTWIVANEVRSTS